MWIRGKGYADLAVLKISDSSPYTFESFFTPAADIKVYPQITLPYSVEGYESPNRIYWIPANDIFCAT